MKSRVDKLLRNYPLAEEHKFISTGSCRLCKPCRCKVGEKCANPDSMTYSFEALGIDVGAMTEELLNFQLMWYKKGNLHQYTSVVAGLLSEQAINHQIFLSELKKYN